MIEQLGIALTGVIAIFLTQTKHVHLQRYACLFGLAAQPFWFYAAWTAHQWGILFMGALYTAAWGKGLWTHWLSPRKAPATNEHTRLLGWISHRSRHALFSFRRSERDAALSDINYRVQKYAQCWDSPAAKRDPNVQWMGESP